MPVDSPNRNASCPLACFSNLKASIKSERFSMSQYLLNNKVPEPDSLKGLVEGPQGQACCLIKEGHHKVTGRAPHCLI